MIKPLGGLAIVDHSFSGNKGLYLVFPRGRRPDRRAMAEFVTCQSTVSISHDPLTETPIQLATLDGKSALQSGETLEDNMSKQDWLELLYEGLSFDLVGLAPGACAPFPQVAHRFDLATLPDSDGFEVVHIAPGKHLSGGERSMPVARGMLSLARDMVDHFEDLQAIIWPESQSAIGHQFFESVVTAWLEGGPFPALGLTAFHETADGAIQSEGLSFWVDQELRIEPPLSSDKVEATRLGVRLVNQLVVVGGLDTSERVIAPDGTRLVMRSSRNGKFVRVWRE